MCHQMQELERIEMESRRQICGNDDVSILHGQIRLEAQRMQGRHRERCEFCKEGRP
jgi:hypothetical protein